jgi:hypothetical protein
MFLGFTGARGDGSAVQAVRGKLKPIRAKAITTMENTFLLSPLVSDNHWVIVMCGSPCLSGSLALTRFSVNSPLWGENPSKEGGELELKW